MLLPFSAIMPKQTLGYPPMRTSNFSYSGPFIFYSHTTDADSLLSNLSFYLYLLARELGASTVLQQTAEKNVPVRSRKETTKRIN